MIALTDIKNHLQSYDPTTLVVGGNKHAAVALLLRTGGDDVEALFIERARHHHDPWSGQMALPGGMVESFDPGPRGAAEREVLEEVGVSLPHAEYLGQLDDQQGRHRGHPGGIIIQGFVYSVADSTPVHCNHEVAQAVWVPLQRFLDRGYYTQVVHPVEPDERFPGVRVSNQDHHIVWGLTRRFIASFFRIINIQFDD